MRPGVQHCICCDDPGIFIPHVQQTIRIQSHMRIPAHVFATSHRRSECCAGTDKVVSPASPDWLWAPTQWCHLHSSSGECSRSLTVPMGPAFPSPSAACVRDRWPHPLWLSRPRPAPGPHRVGFDHLLNRRRDWRLWICQSTTNYCWPASERYCLLPYWIFFQTVRSRTVFHLLNLKICGAAPATVAMHLV